MYESFFGLSQRPFTPAPRPGCYFPAASIDSARATLTRCVDRAEGPAVLIGAHGTGKTLLLQVLAEHFKDRFAVVLLGGSQCNSRRELLQSILFELGLPYQEQDDGELRLGLLQHFSRNKNKTAGMLLLVDEAHALSAVVLEEMRMLTNLSKQGETVIRLVATGTLSLEEQLAVPELSALSQRLAARCYLDSFDHAESTDYIRYQVAVAGGQVQNCFTPTACDRRLSSH